MTNFGFDLDIIDFDDKQKLPDPPVIPSNNRTQSLTDKTQAPTEKSRSTVAKPTDPGPLDFRLARLPEIHTAEPAPAEPRLSRHNKQTPDEHSDAESFAPADTPSMDPPSMYAQEQIASDLWWSPLVAKSLDPRPAEDVFPELLVQLAIQNSPKILAISQRPLVRETEIGEARAEFDPELFLRTQFDDRVDPVGNDLTTGGPPFLKDHIWTGDTGIRKKLYSGGQLELKQRLGFHNSNSRFFDPQDQGTATLEIDFSQPLLRGRGKYYNRSQILIAQVGTGISWDKFAAELQDELTEVVSAYWTLFYSRSVLLQKQRNVERGQIILDRLEGRSGLDSLPSQIARARSAVQSRKTELANAIRDVKNAETEIRRLTNNPQAFQAAADELIPVELPVTVQVGHDLEGVIADSMEKRPEVREALKRAKIAAIQRNVSSNELLPELNLIFNTYVSALDGETDIPNAWSQQFAGSTPGYAVGFEFAVPYGRRAAKAKLTRSQIIVNQIRNEINQVLLEVVAESQIAWRRVVSANLTLRAATEAISAARADLEQNQARWESFGLVEGDLAEGQTPTTLLDQLLDAQQRLTIIELTYSQALFEYKIAEVGLKKASGTLLNYQQISFGKSYGPDGPAIDIQSGAFDQR